MKRFYILGLFLILTGLSARAATFQNYFTTNSAATVGSNATTALAGLGGTAAGPNLAGALSYTNFAAEGIGQSLLTGLTVGTRYTYTSGGDHSDYALLIKGVNDTDAGAQCIQDTSGVGWSGTASVTLTNSFVATQTTVTFMSAAVSSGAVPDTLVVSGVTTGPLNYSLQNYGTYHAAAVDGTFNGTNLGSSFQAVVTVFPTNVYAFAGTVTGSSGSSILTAATGAFTYTNSRGAVLPWAKGFQISLVTGSEQHWVRGVDSSTQIRVYPTLTSNPSGAAMNVYPPALIVTDINGVPQMYIGSDGSIGVSSGTLGGNGNSPAAGRISFEDGGYSMRMGMLEPAAVPLAVGECWGIYSDTNNAAPQVLISATAPKYSFQICGTNGVIGLQASTNKPSGSFVLSGTSTVNVGNTMVTGVTKVIIEEQSANGGTQLGQTFVTGTTPGTGFAVKGGAADTSICFYWLVQTN